MPRHKIATASAHSALSRHSPPQAKIGCPFTVTHVLVFEPLGPAGSAKPVSGMRQRRCGLRASPLHMGFDRSAMLLTGLGFESGFMPFRRSGKPHTMD